MGIITNNEFLYQQNLLGSGFAMLVELEGLVASGLMGVVDSQDAEVEVALLQPYSFNLDDVYRSRTAVWLQKATVALERHITDRSGMDLNDWLYLNNLKVCQDFASLSSIVATAIDESNVEE